MFVGEEIGRVGESCTAMRTVVESENGDEKREGC